MKHLLILTVLVSIIGCNTSRSSDSVEAETSQMPLVITESWITPSRPEDNVDSIGVYHGPGGDMTLVTAKATDRILAYSANTGELLNTYGLTGSQPGQYKRPNGIQVIDDLMMVVERDNHRVQITRLPDFSFVAMVGQDQLKRPYGLTCYKDDQGLLQLLVTDDYELEPGKEAPEDFYGERVKHFSLDVSQDSVKANLVKSFGDHAGPGMLFKVESIMADVENKRLFISDEKGPSPGVKIYTLDGQFTGQVLDTESFLGEPEGLAIMGPYLATTDQQPNVSVFHLYNRKSLQPVAAFQGKVTANTDGIAISATSMDHFPIGALWAIHDDQALACFNLETISQAIQKK